MSADTPQPLTSGQIVPFLRSATACREPLTNRDLDDIAAALDRDRARIAALRETADRATFRADAAQERIDALEAVADAAQTVMDVADLWADDRDNPLWDSIPVELADPLDALREALDKLDAGTPPVTEGPITDANGDELEHGEPDPGSPA